jgi:hypothetical protein
VSPNDDLDRIRPLLDRILEELRETGLDAAEIRPMRLHGPVVADASAKLVVEGRRGRPEAVLMLSNPAAPEAVARDMEGAREALELLGPEVGSVVLLPLLRGEYESQSYAVLPWQCALARNLWRWRAQKYLLAPRLLRWLRDVTRTTRRELEESQLESRVGLPLRRLAEDERFPGAMRRDAEIALARLADGRWRPKVVLAHDDLWKGNILLPRERSARRSSEYGFHVIDWGGLQRSGLPYSDLVRVTTSPALPLGWVRREVRVHASLLDCDQADALSYVLAGIADLGARLDQMPVDRYLESARMQHEFIRTCVAFAAA